MDSRRGETQGRILTALGELRSGAPQARDRAFVGLRRLLAATLAAQHWSAPGRLLRRHRARRLERLEAAIVASVTVLEQVPRDSLDFLIEAVLLEEVLAPAPDLEGDGWSAAAQQVLVGLPADDAYTFHQLRRAADATARVLVEARPE